MEIREMLLTDQEKLVLGFCEKATAEKPITRQKLRAYTMLTDNQNRALIGSLREKGYRIINNNKGYWLSKDDAEFAEWLPKYESYARTILRRSRAMTNYIDGQLDMAYALNNLM